MTIMQVVVSSVILFFLYRYLLHTIGVAKLGVWSVVMATASASRMSELGISGSVVKFVAKYRAHSDVLSVSEVVQTAAISTAVLLSVMLGLLYPIFSWLLKFVIPASDLAEGLAILPYTLISLWCIALGGGIPIGAGGVPTHRPAQLDPDGKQYPLFIADGHPGAGIRAHRSCLRASVAGRHCSDDQLDTPSA